MIFLASDVSVVKGMLEWSQPVHFSLECSVFRRITPPLQMVGYLCFWMSKKETRRYKLLTLAERVDDKEGK